ncbi:hypothetical protein KUTeg_004826, partial [Tegillarca granosa]
IYFNIPAWLQWNKIHSSYTARHVIAGILLVTLLAVILFTLIEFFFLNSKHYLKYENYSPHRHLHDISSQSLEFGPDVHYGIVIDCGSSGSRVYVYFWPPHSGNPKDLLDIQQLIGSDGKPVVKKVTPGLDTFENNPGAASDYLKPLLKYAASHIPKQYHKETLLFILATAGMRLIPPKAQLNILEDLKADIPKEFDFVISDSHFEVITGKMEGVYAWIAANYVLQKFGHEHSLVVVELPGKRTHVRRRTVGMIDMGGGSLQIAFEVTSKVDTIPKHRIAEFNLGCQNTDIDHSYRVHFGHHHGKRVIPDPCLPVGLLQESLDNSHFFKGTGEYKVCQASLVPLLNLTGICEQKPCSMNGVHQPEISFHNNEFYGFSEFWYTMEDVYRIGGLYDSEKFESAAKCFKSSWLTTVLHRGLRFPRDYHQLHSVQLINNRDVQWTLGALIHRTRHLPLRNIKNLELQHYSGSLKLVFTAILLYMKRLKLCPKSRSDLSRVPSMSYFMTDENQIEQGVKFVKGYDYP